MPWTYDYSKEFLQGYKVFPAWRRAVIRGRIKKIKQSVSPLVQASRKGSLAYFPFMTTGNILIAKVDDALQQIRFIKIQVQ